MRKLILLALPLASLMLLAGCDQAGYQSSSGYRSSSTPAQATSATASSSTAASQTTTVSYQPTRNSTTQPLPSGWGYLHEGDLTGGRLSTSASVAMPSTTVARTGGS